MLILFNCTLHQYKTFLQLATHTVACESAADGDLDGIAICTSSAGSSSISVVSVPFDVTGDGPTISLGLASIAPFGESPPSIEWGLRLDSAERRALKHNISMLVKDGAQLLRTMTGNEGSLSGLESSATERSLYMERRTT